MSIALPKRYMHPNDPSLNELYRIIEKIKKYDANCGKEKTRQLLDRIETHNKIIADSSRLNKTSQNTINTSRNIVNDLNEKTKLQNSNEIATEDSGRKRIADFYYDYFESINRFEESVSKQFPDMYLDINDSFFDYLREELDAIDRVGGNSKEASNLLQERIRKHNEDFITKHLNDPIFSRVCGESLDNEQRRAILCDSKYNLVFAEDGSGKTLTICGKIKYLLEKNLAKEEDILVLSYLNTSVDELKDKLSEKYPNLVVKTFHALGSDILSEHCGEKKAVDDQLLAHIKAFFDEKYYKNGEFRDNVARYLSLSPKLPYFTDFIPSRSAEYVNELIDDFKSKDFKVLSKALKSSRDGSKRILTIKKESVKSLEELMVANYLFVNGIKYEYEKPYKFKTATLDKRQYCPDFFLPDYGIYIEHFGTNKAGRARQYSPEEEQEYLRIKEWKEKTHDEFNTVCVKTYSYEFSKKNVFVNLKKNLEDKGVKFKQRWTQNRIEELKSAMLNLYGAKDLSKLIYTLEAFLRLYKSQQYRDKVTWIRAGWKDKNERERLKIDSFQKISEQVDDYCISLLKQNNKIDFDDMILQSTKLLDSSEFGRKYCYKYILVDDFHDTTQIIFDFLEKLVEHGNSKLMAVGDNRQAVDRFKNSDIGKILDLKKITFPNAVTNKLTTIYKREYNKMEMVSE